MASSSDKAGLILVMLALIIGGIIMTFNLVPALGIGFENISSAKSGFWIILCRLVGIFLTIFPIWVLANIIRE